MKRSTVVIVVLIAVLFVAGYGALKQSLNGGTETRDVIVNITQEDIVCVEVLHEDESYTLIKENGWRMKEVEQPLLSGAVNDYFNKTLPMEGKRIEYPSEPSVYGITEDATQVVYTLKNGKKKTIVLGNKTPSETEAYVSDDEGNIYTVYTLVSNALSNRMYHFLDDYIVGFAYEDLSRLVIRNPSGESILRREETQWIYEPDNRAAEEFEVKSKITRYLGGIYALKCFRKTDENLQKYGFDNAEMQLEITLRNGDTTVITAGALEGEYLYITVDEKPFIYCVNRGSFEFLTEEYKTLQVNQ